MNSGMNTQTPQSDDWETPDWLFRALDIEFGFNFDGAANNANTKCKRFTDNIAHAGLLGEMVFCNPPYSKIGLFIHIALHKYSANWVFLLPVRTDNDWFHELVNSPRCEIRWLRKRIKFLEDGKEMGSPRFASMLAIIK